MKNLFDKLGGLIFEPDPAKPADAEAAPAPVAAAPANVAPAVPVATVNPGTYSEVPSVLDVAHVEAQLVGLIEQDPGFAVFKKFSDTADTLTDIITDEGTRFKAAAKTTNADVAVLTTSLQTWQTVLAAEQQHFDANFVAGNEAEIQSINAQAAAIEAQIVELAQKLSELSAQKAKLEQDGVQRTAELGKAKIDFASVVQTLNNRYSAVLNKLSKFLGA